MGGNKEGENDQNVTKIIIGTKMIYEFLLWFQV